MCTQRSVAILITALMLALMCLYSTARAASSSPKIVQLIIKVTDKQGHGIGNAKVNVWKNNEIRMPRVMPDYQEDTNQEGVAVIQVETTTTMLGTPTINLTVRVVKTDYDPGEETIQYSDPVPGVITRDIKLEKPERVMTMLVHVETNDGHAVEGAQVDVWSNTPFLRHNSSGETNAAGDASISLNRFNDFEIKVNKEGYPETKKNVLISGEIPDTAGPYIIKLPKPIGTLVTVTVKDDKDNNGVPNARVVLNGSNVVGFVSATTNDSGVAELAVSPSGTYALTVTQNFYESYSGEVHVEQGEKQAVEVSLKAKEKDEEGRNTIDVTVVAADKSNPTAVIGSNLPLADALVTVNNNERQTSLGTDSSGHVQFHGDFEGDIPITVSADGYQEQKQSVNVRQTVRNKGMHVEVTFYMQSANTEDYVDVTVVSAEKDADGETVPIEGATVRAGGTTTTTDSAGHAKLNGFFDNEMVKVEKQGYKSQSQSVSSSRPNRWGKGAATAAVTFELKPIVTQDTVHVRVLSTDLEGGKETPIVGATVSAVGTTETTDQDGAAKFTGKFAETVEVTASADGYGQKSVSVKIDPQSHNGDVTITMQPNIRLIVEVHDATPPNKAIDQAEVKFKVKGSNEVLPVTHFTNAAGETEMEFRNTADMPLEKLREGLFIEVSKKDFANHETEVTPDLLSTKERRITVMLDPDWSELRASIDALEPQVFAWDADAHANTSSEANTFVDTAKKLLKEAEPIIAQLRTSEHLLTESYGQGSSGINCDFAKPLQDDIRSAETEAKEKSEEMQKILDDANGAAAKCATVADADGLRSSYRKAIKILADIGSVNKRAGQDREQLMSMTKRSTEFKDVLAAMKSKVDELAKIDDAAKENDTKAENYFKHLAEASKTLATRQISLKAQLAVLSVKAESATSPVPKDLADRLSKMEQILAIKIVEPKVTEEPPEVVTDMAVIARFNDDAQKIVTQLTTATICDVDTLDATVDGINTILTNASFDIGLAADLPKQADECAQKAGGTTTTTTPPETTTPTPPSEAPTQPETTTPPATATPPTTTTPPTVEPIPEDKGKPAPTPSTTQPPTVEQIPEDTGKPPASQEPANTNQPPEQAQPPAHPKQLPPSNQGNETPGEEEIGPLSGSWKATIPIPSDKCVLTYQMKLTMTGKNTFTGSMVAGGNCYSHDRGNIGRVTLIITGAGSAKMTLGNIRKQIPVTFTSSAITMPVLWTVMTFKRQ